MRRSALTDISSGFSSYFTEGDEGGVNLVELDSPTEGIPRRPRDFVILPKHLGHLLLCLAILERQGTLFFIRFKELLRVTLNYALGMGRCIQKIIRVQYHFRIPDVVGAVTLQYRVYLDDICMGVTNLIRLLNTRDNLWTYHYFKGEPGFMHFNLDLSHRKRAEHLPKLAMTYLNEFVASVPTNSLFLIFPVRGVNLCTNCMGEHSLRGFTHLSAHNRYGRGGTGDTPHQFSMGIRL